MYIACLVKEYRLQLGCSCGAMTIIEEYQEHDSILEFLIGLNDSYSASHSQILMQAPLPNINKVYSTIIQEERQCKLGNVLPHTSDSHSS